MEADRWKKIEGLYEAAIALPPGRRATKRWEAAARNL